jgi:cellulose synthase (UDP-forming)
MRARNSNPLMQPMLSPAEWRLQTAGVLLWTACLVFFWSWWLRPDHFSDWLPYGLVTFCLAWLTLNQLYFFVVTHDPLRPVPSIDPPTNLRVAMVVTKAPSEPFEIVKTTLEAMLAQEWPHDTWLADEAPTPETIAWAEAHGVRISTRFGVADYHRATWPRRTRCKEGNLAYFYDHYGYEMYDVVVQLDADHVPEPGYLRAMVQPFADPKVGYVSAPSICDSNAERSWSARGRLYAEASMHGTLQAGYNRGWAPVCIGSHYAVRTAALKQIGGLGPELAEDHSTTLLMSAGGWRGVHAIDAIAHGLGPETFADLAVQEFQWSRSLVTILLQYTKGCLPTLTGRQRFQFLYSQLWYPLSSLTMLLGVLMPLVALLFDLTFVNVSYFEFLAHVLPMWFVATLLAFAQRRTGTYRPYNAKILSWEGAVFVCARWPWVVLGTATAIADAVLGRRTEFRVTPKGSSEARDLPVSVIAPYAVISLVSGVVALAVSGVGIANGYYLLAALNAALYGAVFTVIFVAHRRENGMKHVGAPWLARMGAAVTLAVVPAAATTVHGLEILDAVSWRSNVRFTETSFSVAGAGMTGASTRRFAFTIKWPGAETR